MEEQEPATDYIDLDSPLKEHLEQHEGLPAEEAGQSEEQLISMQQDQQDPSGPTVEPKKEKSVATEEQRTQVDESKVPEWEAMREIPEHWRPLPLFLVRNVPIKESVTEGAVKDLVEGIPGIKVHSVNFDDRPIERGAGRRSALVRLQPPPLPWEQQEPESSQQEEKVPDAKKRKPPRDGDAVHTAAWAVQQLKAHQPHLQLEGETLAFELSSLQVQLYVGNLSLEWQEDKAFVKAMAEYGKLERAFVMRNAAGLSKGYGFVEYSLPGSALACKQAMDEIERNMRPDPRKPKTQPKAVQDARGSGEGAETATAAADSKAAGADNLVRSQALKVGGWPEGSGRLVKLLRAEWATMRNLDVLFSKVLYVANLRTNQGSQQQLREIFQAYGKIAEVTVPVNKATNATKGFAFVAFANGLAADRAYRALELSGSEEIGGALVSFANSAKATDMQSRQSASATGRQPSGGRAPGRNGPPSTGVGSRTARAPAIGGPVPIGGRSFPGRGMGRGEGDLLRQQQHQQQQLQMQAGMAAQVQMARQMELRMQQQMQQQMQAQQAQMQAQLRQAQMQVQQIQQQAQQLQRQAVQAQAKAAAEAEARKRAEDEARRAAAATRADVMAKRGSAHFAGYSAGAPEAATGMARSSTGAYAGHGSGYGASGPSPSKYAASQSGYSGQAGYGSAQGYSASAGAGYADAYGSQAYGGHDYGYGGHSDYAGGEAAAYGQHSAYDGQEGYAHAGYGQPGYAGYGESRPGAIDGAYSGAAEYGAAAYGQGASEAGYGAGDGYDQHAAYAGYGQPGAGGGGGTAQKRANPYHQQAGHGSYGNGSYASQGGRDYGKRPRY